MMTDWYYHLLDIAHGIVMAVLMYFVFRLLVFRREGAVRVRYLAIVNITAHSGLITFDFMNSPNGIEQTQTTPTHDGRFVPIKSRYKFLNLSKTFAI